VSSNDTQVGGTHYQTAYAAWDFAYDALGGDGCLLAVNKYLVRWRKKNGLEDLKKARHYLTKFRELVEQGRAELPRRLSPEAATSLLSFYTEVNDMDRLEEAVLGSILRHDLPGAFSCLEKLIVENSL
jgi:hypothetical protein